ncbi:hypothetical protein [Cephaloticoccus primus]|uniref:hypothetical protein n=1 Tax=Cephaloticoccus primus TaxID=1548207 RepID=UPI0012E8FB16|nr:hypothetical protein [Cephaloticoccus primus]
MNAPRSFSRYNSALLGIKCRAALGLAVLGEFTPVQARGLDALDLADADQIYHLNPLSV